MRKPMLPPDLRIFHSSPPTVEEMVQFERILAARVWPAPGGKYRHWDILRHLTPPAGLSAEEWWYGIKFARGQLYRNLPLLATNGRPFCHAMVDLVFPSCTKSTSRARGH